MFDHTMPHVVVVVLLLSLFSFPVRLVGVVVVFGGEVDGFGG